MVNTLKSRGETMQNVKKLKKFAKNLNISKKSTIFAQNFVIFDKIIKQIKNSKL